MWSSSYEKRILLDWFDQLPGVNLENAEPAIRAYTDKLSNLRPDEPIIYKDRYNKIWTLQLKPIEMSLLPVEILKSFCKELHGTRIRCNCKMENFPRVCKIVMRPLDHDNGTNIIGFNSRENVMWYEPMIQISSLLCLDQYYIWFYSSSVHNSFDLQIWQITKSDPVFKGVK